MRKVLIALATAGTALALATPAAAQYYPAPPPPPYAQGYGPGYGQGYGYGQQNFGHVRALQIRIDRVQANINRLDARDVIREGTARRLRDESRQVERQLRRAARYGLNPYEANDVERRVFNLERRVRMAMGRGWRSGYGYAGYNGYNNGQWRDRDRDGRNDRYEDDRGRERDGRWDRDDD